MIGRGVGELRDLGSVRVVTERRRVPRHRDYDDDRVLCVGVAIRTTRALRHTGLNDMFAVAAREAGLGPDDASVS